MKTSRIPFEEALAIGEGTHVDVIPGECVRFSREIRIRRKMPIAFVSRGECREIELSFDFLSFFFFFMAEFPDRSSSKVPFLISDAENKGNINLSITFFNLQAPVPLFAAGELPVAADRQCRNEAFLVHESRCFLPRRRSRFRRCPEGRH